MVESKEEKVVKLEIKLEELRMKKLKKQHEFKMEELKFKKELAILYGGKNRRKRINKRIKSLKEKEHE